MPDVTAPSGARPTSLQIAHRLLGLGLSVIPVPRPRPGVPQGQPGDGKVPAIAWRPYQTRLPTPREIDAWFGAAAMNLAVITGATSGVVVIDADEPEALRWLVRRLTYTPWQTQTARGFHLWYRHPDVRVSNRARIQTRDGRAEDRRSWRWWLRDCAGFPPCVRFGVSRGWRLERAARTGARVLARLARSPANL